MVALGQHGRVTFLPFIAIAAVGSIAPALADKHAQKTDDKITITLLGPFLLGDLYDRMPDQTLLGLPVPHLKSRILAAGGPTHAEVVKALNQCKLYVIDRTVTIKRRGKTVKEFAEEDAQVVAEGPLTFALKDSNRQRFDLQVKQARLCKATILNGEYRTNNIQIFLIAQRGTGAGRRTKEELTFTTRTLSWDLNGKTTWAED